MRVTLPTGATMLSVEVGGEAAKPVTGADGTRVPLLRTGFRPEGAYSVSFVYMNTGEAFAKDGDTQLALPKIDVPVTMLEWELFLPDRYSAKANGGNVMPARLLASVSARGVTYVGQPGEVAGHAVDATGAPLPGVTMTVTGSDGVRRQGVTDASGLYVIRDVPSGTVILTGELAGFRMVRRSVAHDAKRPRTVDIQMEIAGLAETVTVTGATPPVAEPQQNAPSQNVLNLQRRVAGVLPVRVDVPRSGTSYQFVRPLVLDEETTVSFRYKRR